MNNYLDIAPHWIGGRPESSTGGAPDVHSEDPFDGTIRWSAASASADQIERALLAAKAAHPAWTALGFDGRASIIKSFGEQVSASVDELARLISQENGKPVWDAKTEVNGLIVKVQASIEAFEERAAERRREVRGMVSATKFKSHGVMAVLGPFNFPMSMPNSHILPSLLSGNTVVFKPSELTPLSGLVLTKLWHDAGLPPGVINCISGTKNVGENLISSPLVDGVLFIGSRNAGLSIRRALWDHPEKIAALEMGGNSPLVIWSYDNLDAAVFCAIQSSIISGGQRCTAARRLIIRAKDQEFVDALIQKLSALRIGHHADSPEPYYGPLIRKHAAAKVVAQFEELSKLGGRVLVQPSINGPNQSLVRPGLIDMTGVNDDPDEEIFGPVIKLYRVSSFDEAVLCCNNTKYGLAAGIVTSERSKFEAFYDTVQAGIINWNQQLTGATALAPFGGIRQSGNHRPAGYLSVDYCSYPVASFENEVLQLPASLPPGMS